MRRALLLALLLPLAACGVSLQQHARMAALSRDLLDTAGEAIEREAKAHWDLVDEQGIEVEHRREVVKGTFAPVEKAYAAAKVALAAYIDAILAAERRGDEQLAPSTVGAVLGAWRVLVEAGQAVGVSVPGPPPALQEVATQMGSAR